MKNYIIQKYKKIISVVYIFLLPVVSFAQVPSANLDIKINNPFKGGSDFSGIINTLFKYVILPLASTVIVLVIIWSGFKFLTNRDKPTEIAKARVALGWAVVGAAIILGATGISAVIQGTLCGQLFECGL